MIAAIMNTLTQVSVWGMITASVLSREMVAAASSSIHIPWGKSFKENAQIWCNLGKQCNLDFSDNIGNWNVSEVTDMSGAFSSCSRLQNTEVDLSNWDISKVTNMAGMFGCEIGTTIWKPNLETWNVSAAFRFDEMFMNCQFQNGSPVIQNESPVIQNNYRELFKEAVQKWCVSEPNIESSIDNIGDWDVSQVTNMNGAFLECSRLQKTDVDLRRWDVSRVTDMTRMFGCKIGTTIRTPNLEEWVVTKVLIFDEMFKNCQFENGTPQLDGWGVYAALRMKEVFRGTNFNGKISEWDVSRVTNMHRMFQDASEFNHNLFKWDVSKVEDMTEMFTDATKFNQEYLAFWDNSGVKNESKRIQLPCPSFTTPIFSQSSGSVQDRCYKDGDKSVSQYRTACENDHCGPIHEPDCLNVDWNTRLATPCVTGVRCIAATYNDTKAIPSLPPICLCPPGTAKKGGKCIIPKPILIPNSSPTLFGGNWYGKSFGSFLAIFFLLFID